MKQIKDNEWFAPTMRKHLMACCDCGLVHWMDFKIKNNQLLIRAKRARNKTAQRRKKPTKRSKGND